VALQPYAPPAAASLKKIGGGVMHLELYLGFATTLARRMLSRPGPFRLSPGRSSSAAARFCILSSASRRNLKIGGGVMHLEFYLWWNNSSEICEI